MESRRHRIGGPIQSLIHCLRPEAYRDTRKKTIVSAERGLKLTNDLTTIPPRSPRRSRSGAHPFRFIWNRSQATADNVYLILYPRGPLRDALKAHPELARQVFESLKGITPAQLLSEGRVYGGGLHKVEPKELAQIPARLVLDAIETHVRLTRQEKLFA